MLGWVDPYPPVTQQTGCLARAAPQINRNISAANFYPALVVVHRTGILHRSKSLVAVRQEHNRSGNLREVPATQRAQVFYRNSTFPEYAKTIAIRTDIS